MWMLLTFFRLIGSLQCSLLQTTFLDHLKVFPFIQNIILPAKWRQPQETYLSLQVALAAGFPLGRALVLRLCQISSLPTASPW